MKMKILATVILSLVSIPSFAAHAVCYDAGRTIYDQDIQTKDLNYFDGIYTFVEVKSQRMVLTNSNCIVDLKIPSRAKHRHKA